MSSVSLFPHYSIWFIVIGLCLVHPDAPADWSCFFVGNRTARQLEGQFDLTVMIALMPDHVLEQKNWMVIVKVHIPPSLHSASYCSAHSVGALIQKLRHAAPVTLGSPLFFGHGLGELRCVFQNKHKTHTMDVPKKFCYGW